MCRDCLFFSNLSLHPSGILVGEESIPETENHETSAMSDLTNNDLGSVLHLLSWRRAVVFFFLISVFIDIARQS